MEKANAKIRKMARNANVPLWAVAMRLGISEPSFLRWLRTPLEEGLEAQIVAIIRDLREEEDDG